MGGTCMQTVSRPSIACGCACPKAIVSAVLRSHVVLGARALLASIRGKACHGMVCMLALRGCTPAVACCYAGTPPDRHQLLHEQSDLVAVAARSYTVGSKPGSAAQHKVTHCSVSTARQFDIYVGGGRFHGTG